MFQHMLSWFRHPSQTASSRRTRALQLEALEDRSVPAFLAVNTTGDGNVRDEVLSLREASWS